jgi:putative ABC transport system substrate-binding protein
MKMVWSAAAALAVSLLVAPPGTEARQPEEAVRVAYLATGEVPPPLWQEFVKGMSEHGWVEGQNVVLEYRTGRGDRERLASLAQQLVLLKPAVILTGGSPATLAVKRATTTIPIVMVGVGDPVRYGLVASLTQPEANLTGLSFLANDLSVKALELVREVLPAARRVVALGNPSNPGAPSLQEDLQAAGPKLGLSIQFEATTTDHDLDRQLKALEREPPDALFIVPNGFLIAARQRILDSAAANRVPALSINPLFAASGALMTYSPNFPQLLRRAAWFADRVLRGASPRELPVEQPTKFDLIVNRKTAKALGLQIPQSILLRADRMIE